MIYKNLIITTLLIISLNSLGQGFKRIISLSPAATFNLMELNSENKLVGCTSFCDLSDNKDLVVASAISMNMEKVIALQPDAVIYTTMFKPNQIERLKQYGIHTELFKSPKNWDETCEQFIRLGELVNKKNEAQVYIDSLQKQMNTIKKSIPEQNPKLKMFLEIGAKPLFTAIPNTFMHDYIEVLNCTNIASDQTGGTITREKVLIKNPDVIVLVTMGTVSDEEKSIWQNYKELNAAKSDRIFIVDASLACRPTPYNFYNTIVELNKLIYDN